MPDAGASFAQSGIGSALPAQDLFAAERVVDVRPKLAARARLLPRLRGTSTIPATPVWSRSSAGVGGRSSRLHLDRAASARDPRCDSTRLASRGAKTAGSFASIGLHHGRLRRDTPPSWLALARAEIVPLH